MDFFIVHICWSYMCFLQESENTDNLTDKSNQ